MFKDLYLNIPPWLGRPPEHWWASDNERPRGVLAVHSFDEVIKVPKDTCILICGSDEGIAFMLQNCCRTFDCRVDEGNDLQARTQFADRIQQLGELSALNGGCLTVQIGTSGSMDPHQNLEVGYMRSEPRGNRVSMLMDHVPNIMFPAPTNTTLKSPVPGIWDTLEHHDHGSPGEWAWLN